MRKDLLILGATGIGVAAIAIMILTTPTANAKLESASQLNASQCNTGGAPIVNVTFKVSNDADSGVAGNVWALDNYNKSVKVWSQADGTFCATVKYEGQFVTLAGASPNNTGTLVSGVKGSFEGGYQAAFNGTFTPTLNTKGNIGAYDFQCDAQFNCPGSFSWLSAYFTGNTAFDQPYWGWNYHAGKNGEWVNASTGNSGDITGN